MTSTTTTLNQVDLPAVRGLVEAIQANPDKAQTRWVSTVTWTGAFRSESQVRDFAPQPSDEPPGLGGSNTAPNPVEQLLSALGNCLSVGYAAALSAHGVEIDSLAVDVDGDLDLHAFLGLRPGNAGFSEIRAKVRLVADADQETLDTIHRQVVATSPVGNTLVRPIPVSIDLV